MKDLQADSARAVDLEMDVPGRGRLAILLKVDRDQGGETTVDVVNITHTPADADSYSQLMTVNVPDSVPRLIGMAGVVELCGIDEESVGEFILAKDFPASVQL